MSEEQKALRRGKPPPNKGKKLSEEVRKRISDGHKGQKAWNKGKKFSEESKRKMSESSKGQKAWNKGMTKEEEAIYRQTKGLL